MTQTNCDGCGLEINAEISPCISTGHLCQDCYFEYKLTNIRSHT